MITPRRVRVLLEAAGLFTVSVAVAACSSGGGTPVSVPTYTPSPTSAGSPTPAAPAVATTRTPPATGAVKDETIQLYRVLSDGTEFRADVRVIAGEANRVFNLLPADVQHEIFSGPPEDAGTCKVAVIGQYYNGPYPAFDLQAVFQGDTPMPTGLTVQPIGDPGSGRFTASTFINVTSTNVPSVPFRLELWANVAGPRMSSTQIVGIDDTPNNAYFLKGSLVRHGALYDADGAYLCTLRDTPGAMPISYHPDSGMPANRTIPAALTGASTTGPVRSGRDMRL